MSTRLLLAAVLGGWAAIAAAGGAQTKVFHAEDATFSLQVPAMWGTNTESGEKYGADVLVYEQARVLQAPDGMVRISVRERRSRDAAKDFAQYLQAYQVEYPGARLEPFSVAHPKYGVRARKIALPSGHDEYTAFVSPAGREVTFVVAMTKVGGVAPAPAEKAAFRSVLASLKLLKDGARK